jgi:phosphoserine phosphatase RsbU/P
LDGDGPRSIVSVYEPAATVARQIRRRLRPVLTAWGVADEVVEDALLVVEELVANVVDHARTRFELVVRLAGEVLRVAVRDEDDGAPRLQPFDPHARRGRGLQVVARLAHRWGCDQHEHGKTVWVELTA